MADSTVSSVMDVVVVGCGASGVAALRRLHEAGLRILGLEAANRIGGRINTVPFGSSVVDLGAQWCEGEKDNAVFELVRDLNVLDHPTSSEQVFLLSDGSLVPEEVGSAFIDDFNSILDGADKNNTLSLSGYLREQINKKSKNTLTEPFLEWFEHFNHVGPQDNPKRAKSLRGLKESWPCEGEFFQNWKDKGYRTILDVLLKSHPNPEEKITVEIFLNKEVETIKWKRTKQATNTNPLVQIVCKDGSLYAAKCVIVTVSIAVLQERHQQMFKPMLPDKKICTINNLQLCLLDKIYVRFAAPWWPKTSNYFSIIWQQHDKIVADEDWWITEVYGANTVEYQSDLLCFWLYGDGAREMEKKELEAVKEGVKKILEMFFKNYIVTEIVDVIRSQWSGDPLTRGAYSYRCVDTEETASGAAILAEPLYLGGFNETVPVVCFAGEATSLHRHGAVHGAVEAGLREADRVIEFMKK